MTNAGWYVAGGLALGVIASYAYRMYRDSKPNTVDIKLITKDKIPNGATATFNVITTDKQDAIKEITLTKVDENTYTGQIPLKSLPVGAYIAQVNFYKDEKAIGTIETEMTIPNDLGLSLPARTLYGEDKVELNLRG